MGLDVYLQRHPNWDAYNQYADEQDAAHEAIYAKHRSPGADGLDNNQCKAARAECDQWDTDHPGPGKPEDIQQDSALDPDHLFKLGYFRSSYNGSGINTVLRAAIGKDLYSIFGQTFKDVEPLVRPDWVAALRRAREVRDEYAQFHKDTGGVRIEEIRYNEFLGMDGVVVGAKQAMAEYRTRRMQEAEWIQKRLADGKTTSHDRTTPEDGPANWFGTSKGHYYFGEPMKVRAIFPGLTESYKNGKPMPCLYVVFEPGKDPDEKYDDGGWILMALDIVIETIEYVLKQEDPSQYALCWSA